MISTDVLILGGGLAGLSTAYHLDRLGRRRLRHLVVEKDGRVGGRAGSVAKDGFLFDYTGHLLHLHDPYGKRLITSLLRGNLAVHERSSWIHSHGRFTRYPFQANTYGLPPRVVAECVAGFMKNVHRPPKLGSRPSFEAWCLNTFGEGISKHFMIPFNRKLWLTRLGDLTTEWQGRFLPRPTPEEVLYGALVDQKKFFGYNAYFRYPLRGASQALPDALAARVGTVRLGSRVTRVDLAQRVAVVEGLGEVRYERLVNTMPLVDFLDMAGPLPAAVRSARRQLRHITVYNLNIGIKRANVSDKHWIYFPEKRFVFYRAGFTSNFSRYVAPKGTSSMYIEVSRRPGQKVDLDRLERQCLDGLRACGILKASDRLASRVWMPIECAYVVYDRRRTPGVGRILPFLSRKGVSSIGRWGGWKYSFMEETVLDGKRCAERLLGVKEEPESAPQRPLTPLK
ncbi:MAG: FAD-dependent oxidoreductase [Elusimicrobiota bacterium]